MGFLQDGLNVGFHFVQLAGQRIEIAIAAFFNTERDMDVETSQFIALHTTRSFDCVQDDKGIRGVVHHHLSQRMCSRDQL